MLQSPDGLLSLCFLEVIIDELKGFFFFFLKLFLANQPALF